MIKAGIIGATGYAGAELVRLLSRHPAVDIISCASRSYAGESYADIYGAMTDIKDAVCDREDLPSLAEEADVIFTATPQGYLASQMSETLLRQAKIIDLSADFRMKDAARYEKWYGIHGTPSFLSEAVYGLPELFRKEIKNARLVANPGCYTTCSILLLYPLLAAKLIDPLSIIIDAKSGVSGAGRKAEAANLFCEVNESVKAYAVAVHRHTPEIEEQLARAAGQEMTVQFTPHLVPMMRGILATAYATIREGVTSPDIRAAYERYYQKEKFVRLLAEGKFAETRFVKGSNYMDISYRTDERTGRLIAIGAIDNLIKGAAGQAVQNMNLLFDLPEATGLDAVPAAI